MAQPPQLVAPPNMRIPVVSSNGGLSTGHSRFLQHITDALNGTYGVAAANIAQVQLGTGRSDNSGSGPPNGVVPGKIGDEYTNLTGGSGSTKWVKNSGVAGSNTGWTAIA